MEIELLLCIGHTKQHRKLFSYSHIFRKRPPTLSVFSKAGNENVSLSIFEV